MCFHRSARKSGFARRLNLANIFFLRLDVTMVKLPVNRLPASLPVGRRIHLSRWAVFICWNRRRFATPGSKCCLFLSVPSLLKTATFVAKKVLLELEITRA